MSTTSEVELFLNDFKIKYKVFDIIFSDYRKKNTQALLDLDITPFKRKEIIENITINDFSEGPLNDALNSIASMWVFGKQLNGKEIYIKISMGMPSSQVICISFHEAEFKMKFPFKK